MKAMIDWSDVESAAKEAAGNWREFDCFAWHRGCDLEDADNWMVSYTSNRDSGLLVQSNEKAINKRLEQYAEGGDSDLVFERHTHWACGYLDGFSLRVFRPDGTVSPAFEEFCRIQEQLEDYPLLDESDYSEREYTSTLENYCSEAWRLRDTLPEGWEADVYRWFSENGHDEHTENRDDQGGWAPREALIDALKALGLLDSDEE